MALDLRALSLPAFHISAGTWPHRRISPSEVEACLQRQSLMVSIDHLNEGYFECCEVIFTAKPGLELFHLLPAWMQTSSPATAPSAPLPEKSDFL
jgi:hypothetical protein